MTLHLGDLRALYPAPKERALRKELTRLDPHCRRFIGLSPFVVLASAGADGSVLVWDLSTRSVVRRLSSPARVAALAFADPAGSVLVAGTEDGRLLTWTLGTGAAR